MVLNGKGGGNTKTGLIFEGETDLETFFIKTKWIQRKIRTRNGFVQR